jgi:hypothetical protein
MRASNPQLCELQDVPTVEYPSRSFHFSSGRFQGTAGNFHQALQRSPFAGINCVLGISSGDRRQHSVLAGAAVCPGNWCVFSGGQHMSGSCENTIDIDSDFCGDNRIDLMPLPTTDLHTSEMCHTDKYEVFLCGQMPPRRGHAPQ